MSDIEQNLNGNFQTFLNVINNKSQISNVDKSNIILTYLKNKLVQVASEQIQERWQYPYNNTFMSMNVKKKLLNEYVKNIYNRENKMLAWLQEGIPWNFSSGTTSDLTGHFDKIVQAGFELQTGIVKVANIRNLLEQKKSKTGNKLVAMTATDQCEKAAIAKSALPFQSTTPLYNMGGLPIGVTEQPPIDDEGKKKFFTKGLCYLCGSELSKVSSTSPYSHKDIECEHIIPIKDMCLLILAFTDVAMRDNFNQYDATLQYLMKLSYLWSHSVCNQVKTNILFVTPPTSGNNVDFKVNNDVINNYLKQLEDIVRENQIELIDNGDQTLVSDTMWANNIHVKGSYYIKERINLIVQQLNNFHKCNDNSEVELFNMFLKLKLINMLPPEYIGRWAYSVNVDTSKNKKLNNKTNNQSNRQQKPPKSKVSKNTKSKRSFKKTKNRGGGKTRKNNKINKINLINIQDMKAYLSSKMLGGDKIFNTETGKEIINNIHFVNNVTKLHNSYSNNTNRYIIKLNEVFNDKFGSSNLNMIKEDNIHNSISYKNPNKTIQKTIPKTIPKTIQKTISKTIPKTRSKTKSESNSKPSQRTRRIRSRVR